MEATWHGLIPELVRVLIWLLWDRPVLLVASLVPVNWGEALPALPAPILFLISH